jgi:hypothetical protein
MVGVFFILISVIPVLWLAVVAFVTAACQVAARADGRRQSASPLSWSDAPAFRHW